MCGIVGIFERTGAPADRVAVDAMTRAIRHRGPDHSAVFTDHQVGLGYVRLSILDLSPAGNQPMEDETGQFVCVYNGEVYNFFVLRQELESEGVRFRSRSDTEVVVNLFARQGVSGIKRLNGIFGLAIWSKRDRELWVFRDPIGVKPVYYFLDNERLIFASELKAILASTSETPTMSPEGLLNYLTYGHAVAPVTIYQNVHKLMPGQYLWARDADVSFGQYFEFPVPSGHRERYRPAQEWVNEANEVLRAAVRRQTIADVPVGVFLSGGIDSSLITALVAQQSSVVETFSIGYPQNGSYDETSDARLVAKHFGTQHYEVQIEESDLVNALDHVVYHYDEPFADAAGLPVYLLSGFARTRVKVALSGEGGDEMFGGYRRYIAERAASAYTRLPASLKDVAIRAAARFGRARTINRITRTLAIENPAARYAGWVEAFSRDALELILEGSLRQHLKYFDGASRYRDLFGRCGNSDVLSRLFFVDSQTWLPDTYLEKVDKVSMAVSLEVRVPFLDLDVVRFAARLPDGLRIRRFTTKYLLRQVAKPLLPAAIVQKPKHGLAVPTDPWFRGGLREYVRAILLDPGSLGRGFFNPAAIETMLQRHWAMKENCERQIWTLLVLELWLQQMGSARLAGHQLARSPV